MQQYGAGTSLGNVRENNEDSYACDTEKSLWIVADGMGGLGSGEAASAISVYTITSLIRQGHGVNQAIARAHQDIKNFALDEGKGTNMGTTLVVLLSKGALYNIFWVGDSRAYVFDEELKQITVDHSVVQQLVERGELTREEAAVDPRKNAVTRALGVREFATVRADSISNRWRSGQKILLCTDGLTDCVSDNEIEAILRSEGSNQEMVDKLIQKALEQGGRDNITAILVSAPKSAIKPDSDTQFPGKIAEISTSSTTSATTISEGRGAG